MVGKKYILKNICQSTIFFNYKTLSDAMWQYQVSLSPGQIKNIWAFDGTLKFLNNQGTSSCVDIIEVLEIFGIQELYSFKFAKVKIRMVDYPDQKPFETVLLLDTIKSESPSLTYEESNRLYQEVLKDYEGETKFKQFQKVKNNEYFNALQVKFSYAITCHKSQGGQWNTVFIEQPYLPDGINSDYIRWLYTAMTRAKNKLYLIGFKDESFVD